MRFVMCAGVVILVAVAWVLSCSSPAQLFTKWIFWHLLSTLELDGQVFSECMCSKIDF